MAQPELNETHNPAAQSWVVSANDPDSDFPIQNLPYGVFSTGHSRRIGVAIGDRILDLTLLEAEGFLRPGPDLYPDLDPDRRVFAGPDLNSFMALGGAAWRTTRATIFDLLLAGTPRLRDDVTLSAKALVPIKSARLHLPFFVRSFTDFYASREHATNVGTIFRGAENALPENWLHMPIGYNGRASTVVVSGTPIMRPCGQIKDTNDAPPRFAPSQKLDMELELGAIVGTPNEMSRAMTTAQAYDMIFGYVVLNDWSARDIQRWEYQPLGPFLSKAFATTISPWIVTREALEPYRVPPPAPATPLLDYLVETSPNSFDIQMQISLTPQDGRPGTISRANYRNMYFTLAQQLAHHASSGCAMCTGDLLGSGTISGSEKASYGSMLELSWNGERPIKLVDGVTRTFVEDGDTLTLSARCQRGDHHLGFGTCTGKVVPAIRYRVDHDP